MVFYAQSTITVISGRERDRQTDRQRQTDREKSDTPFIKNLLGA